MYRENKSRTARQYLLETAGKHKIGIVLLTAADALLGVSGVAFALLLRQILNAAVAGEKEAFLFSVSALAVLISLQLGLRFIRRYYTEKVKSGLENAFKKRLLTTLFRKDFGAVTAVHSARWLSLLTSDAQVTADQMTEFLPGFAGMTVQLAAAFTALVVLQPLFLWFIVPAGAVLLVFSYLFRRRLKALHKNVQDRDAALRECIQEYLSAMTVVRSYVKEDRALKDAEEKMLRHQKARMKRISFSNLCNLGFGILMRGGIFVSLAFCGWGILQGSVSPGSFVAVMQLVGQVQGPMANLTGFLPRYFTMMASAERLMEAESLPEEEKESPVDAESARRFYDENFLEISFQNVDFAYPGSLEPVLRNLSFSIAKGETIAFTGHSGCGKSTVFRLILGLYAAEKGQCCILDRNHNRLKLCTLRRMFSYVPQGKFFMTGTIRQIVSFADPERSGDDAAIFRALRIACAADFVSALDEGLDTVLGEQGLGLSEGQLQRLSVARAVFSGRPIMLLDEATSALDEKTEMQLLSNMKAMTDCTVLIVTHRPAALSICDRIISCME